MKTTRRGLSKSRFCYGLQCPRQLWWRVHEPDAPELAAPASLQAVFERGHRVGELARAEFPGGTLVEREYFEIAEKVADTRAALDARAPAIYEASFVADGVYVAVDVLERRSNGHGLVEVKSSLSVKDQYIPDVAIQLHVLRASGVEVRRAEVMHLHRACRFPDLSNLFVREDVTAAAETFLPKIPGHLRRMNEALAGALPEAEPGPHCWDPYDCPFVERCTPASQDDAAMTGSVVVEYGLAQALRALVPPIAFLDFETINPAIPAWDGCGPFQQVPVQLSCHVVDGGGAVQHHEFLAERSGDPRPAMAAAVVEACAEAETVVAYGAGFERRCIHHLAAHVPHRREELLAVTARLVDLLPIVRDHVQHPGFGGSFGLKAVAPALVEGVNYEELAIGDGATASAALEALLLGPTAASQETRARLAEYCALDTLAMVKLVERLRELAN